MGKKIEKETRVMGIDQTGLTVERREDGTVRICGYAAVFNKDSEDLGFIERIEPGAFKKALKKSDVRALFNHDANLIIGRTGVNLRLKEDDKGLYMEVDPIDTATYRMVAENIRAGLVTQQSFAFTVAAQEWDGDYTLRTIKEVDQIFDVSPVTYPAYPDTSVALRCRDELKEQRGAAGPMIDTPPLAPSGGGPMIADPEALEALEKRYQTIMGKL